MTYIYLGALLFGGLHLFSMVAPTVRDKLKTRLGEGTFKGLYSLLSFLGVALLVVGYAAGRADPVLSSPFYETSSGARHMNMALSWLGFVLIAASHGKGYIKALVRQPMSLGIGLWATGHLLANGERTVVYIFAMLLAVSVIDIVLSAVRGKVPRHQPNARSDILALVIGTVIYLAAAFLFHPYVVGVPAA